MARLSAIGGLFARLKEALSGASNLLWLVGLGGVAACLGTAYWLGWLDSAVHATWLRVVISLLAGGGVFAALRLGVPWLRERRFVREDSSQYVAGGEQSPEEFRAKFTRGLQILAGLPRLRGHAEPVYGLPWFLVIGHPGSGKTTALQASDLFSPLFPVQPGPTQNYDLWLSNEAVVVDTAGRYVVHADPERDRSEWYRLLRLLHHHREREPANGLVLHVAADWLATQADDQLRSEASKLRDRIEEAVRELGVDPPVYLVVTRCDAMEGFAEFFGALPERIRREALGYVDDAGQTGGTAARGAAALARFEAGLRGVYERLHLFRLSILSGSAPDGVRQSLFSLPEEFAALAGRLKTFLGPLFSEDVRYHTPLVRAVFFASAVQGPSRVSLVRRELQLAGEASRTASGGGPFFLHDLYDAMLPRDRGLVATTPRERRRRGFGRLFRSSTVAALFLVPALLLGHAFVTDRRIAGSIDPSECPPVTGSGAASPSRDRSVKAAIEAADRCRQTVETLARASGARSEWSTWVADRSGHIETQLRQQYVEYFGRHVLSPLNEGLDRSFASRHDPLPPMLLVAQRIQLLRRCRDAPACGIAELQRATLDWATLAEGAPAAKTSAPEVDALRRTYAAYVAWQTPDGTALPSDLAADEKRLEGWIRAKSFDFARLMPLVSQRSTPLSLEHYWQLPAPIAVNEKPEVDGACLRAAWEQELAPFLQQVQDAVPEAHDRLQAFRQQYMETCFRQWKRFLTIFSEGSQRWKGSDREKTLVIRLLTEDSPYRLVLRDAADNLSAWLPAGSEAGEDRKWAAEVRDFVSSDRRRAYDKALADMAERLRGQKEFRRLCLELAAEAFREAKTGPDAKSPVLRAWSAAGTGGDEPGTDSKTVLAPLLRDPVRYVWRHALQSAAAELQEGWAKDVVTPLVGLPPAEQIVLLYGPGGKLGGFVDQFVAPFLDQELARPGTMLGEQLPLSADFLQVLGNGKEIAPLLDGSRPPEPITITAADRSKIEGQAALREERTQVQVSCAGKTYRVSTRPVDESERSATVPWAYQSCGDVTVSVYFSNEGPGASRYQLQRRYAGGKGFLHFLYDFRTGAVRYVLDDLEGDPEQWNVLKFLVTGVDVHVTVDLPPSLEGLTTALAAATLPDLAAPASQT